MLAIMKKVWINLSCLLVMVLASEPTLEQDGGVWLEMVLTCGSYGLIGVMVLFAGVLFVAILAYTLPLSVRNRNNVFKMLRPLKPFFTMFSGIVPEGCRLEFFTKVVFNEANSHQPSKVEENPELRSVEEDEDQSIQREDVGQETNHKKQKRKKNKNKRKKRISQSGEVLQPTETTQNCFQPGKRGLVNLGNTCYLNAALQCLHKTYQLNELSLRSPAQQKGPYTEALLTLFTELSKNEQKPFAPTRVKSFISEYNPLFEGYDQQDSAQAMGTMLSMMNDEMNEVKERKILKIDLELRRHQKHSEKLWLQSKKKDHSRQKSFIDDLIYGRYKTVYKCQACQQLYILFQKFHAVYLPIPDKKGQVALEDCFKEFCQAELMDGANKLSCERCKEEKDTIKEMTVYETNRIVIICLKRYNQGAKDEREVEIPFEIDDQTMGRGNNRQKCVYELYGIINHAGRSLYSGHYTATCFDQTNGWVTYNDNSCRQVSEEQVKKRAGNAYTLLYRRKV